MALIEWRDEFNTGMPGVDHEHRVLIRLINSLLVGLADAEAKDVVIDRFGEIFARISAHFALEEKLMRECGYDEYADHKADHERLLDEIRDIMDDYEAGAYAGLDEVLASGLSRWFSRHFRSRDARLHEYMG